MEKIKKTFYKVYRESIRDRFPFKEYIYVQANSKEEALIIGLKRFGGENADFRLSAIPCVNNNDNSKED